MAATRCYRGFCVHGTTAKLTAARTKSLIPTRTTGEAPRPWGGVGLAGGMERADGQALRFCTLPLFYVLGFRLCLCFFAFCHRAFAPSPVVETWLDEKGHQPFQWGAEVRALQ